MPEHQRPLKVFLCHASADKLAVRELYLRLKGEGWIDPWLDAAKILPGQHWTSIIRHSLQEADSIIILISNASVSREGFVQREMNYAWDLSLEKPRSVIYLIPLRLEECEVPFDLRERQWADYFSEKKEETYSSLLESLKLRYEQKLRFEAEERARKDKAEQERIVLEEKARKEAEEKARLGAEERAQWEREEQERKAAEAKARLAAQEKALQEAKERARSEKEEKERKAAEIAAQEKEKHEIDEKARREKRERETAEKIAQQKTRRDAAEKAQRERAARRIAQIAALRETFSNFFSSLNSSLPKTMPFLRITGLAGIVIGVLWLVLPEIPKTMPLFWAAKPTTTVTFTPSPPLSTKTSTMFPTLTLTATKTNTPTLTSTPTPIPPSSILFQKDFEDGLVSELDQAGGIWTVEQEPGGNHYLCGTGPSINPPQIWYRDRKTVWTDYAFETRVKFINGHTLYIIFRHDLGSDEHYGLAINNYGIGFMRKWSQIGSNNSMVLAENRWYTIRVGIQGDQLGVYIDNALYNAEKLQPPVIDHGGIGYVTDPAEKVCFDDIEVWSLK